MFINGDGNCVDILNEAVVTYNNNKHTTINMTRVNASNNPDKVRYYVKSTKFKPKLKAGDSVRNADKRNIFSKGCTSNWSRELFKVNEVLKAKQPTFKTEDINGEITEVKYFEREVLKSEFDIESNIKILKPLNIKLRL